MAVIASHLGSEKTLSCSTPKDSTPEMPQEEQESPSKHIVPQPQCVIMLSLKLMDTDFCCERKPEAESSHGHSSSPNPSPDAEGVIVNEDVIPGLDDTFVEASSPAGLKPEHSVKTLSQAETQTPLLTEEGGSSLRFATYRLSNSCL
jgi:hypothetical protein